MTQPSQKRAACRLNLPALAIGLLLGLPSCQWLDPADPMPAYLRIEPFQVSTNPGAQGSASHNITEAWVQVNGVFLGAYQLPAEVPVLETGPAEITVSAGIRENGIAATPDIYPFYQPISLQRNLEPGQTLALDPRITYRPETRFPLLEAFENEGHGFQVLLRGSDANRIRINRTSPFEGNGSGLIQLTEQQPEVELATNAKYSGLLERGAFVFLEVDYQSDVPVVFGLITTSRTTGQASIRFLRGFNPSETWKKIYFNFSSELSGSISEDYQVILRAAIPLKTDGTLSRTNARIQLDNIKLVHF